MCPRPMTPCSGGWSWPEGATKPLTEPAPAPSVSPLPPTSTSLDQEAKQLLSDVVHVAPSTTSFAESPLVPPSYPPTEVRRWLTCPVFRGYSAKWTPRAEDWTPHRAVGSAIHAGIAAYLKPLIVSSIYPEQQPGSSADPIQTAIDRLKEEYVTQETWGYAGLEALAKKGTAALIKKVTADLLPGAQVLGVEAVVPYAPRTPGGRVPKYSRILDTVLLREGWLEIWDWKSKLNLDDRYWEETIRAVLHQWQLLDYGWHGQEAFGHPVRYAGWGLVVLGPKLKVEFLPVKVSGERLRQWRKDAAVIWTGMWMHETGQAHPWHNWEACTDKHLHFGKECAFMPACHELFGNEDKFSGLYKEKEEHTNAG